MVGQLNVLMELGCIWPQGILCPPLHKQNGVIYQNVNSQITTVKIFEMHHHTGCLKDQHFNSTFTYLTFISIGIFVRATVASNATSMQSISSFRSQQEFQVIYCSSINILGRFTCINILCQTFDINI